MTVDNRALIAVLVCALFASSLVVTVANAQSIPKPSAPEFTVKFEAHPYEEPPVYEIDQYTGENVTIQEGFHVENQSVILTIKNQPFQRGYNGTSYYLVYFIRVKGHYGDAWENFKFLDQSASECTEFSKSIDYAHGAQLDFQVQSIIGHSYLEYIPPAPPLSMHGSYWDQNATDETSDWSNTQTITIPEPSPSESVSPSPSPTSELTPSPVVTSPPIQPSSQVGVPIWLYAVTVVMALAIGVLLGIVITQRKRIRENKLNHD
jgi:hypothetical protein